MNKSLWKIIYPLAALLLCGILVMIERYGVRDHNDAVGTAFVENTYSAPVTSQAECLLLEDQNQVYSSELADRMAFVLDGMKVAYDRTDVSESSYMEKLDQYKTIVIAFEDWNCLSDKLDALDNWVVSGGSIMNTITPFANETFTEISIRIGVLNSEYDFTDIDGLRILNDTMIGSQTQEEYLFSKDGSDTLEVMQYDLTSDCNIYIESANEGTPILWSKDRGAGRFVMLNMNSSDKYMRGILSTAYSLMQDYCIYPVINASAYYIDDFPSPVPSGDGTFIERDYGVDIKTFYSTIWLNEVLSWEKEYGIKHTGMIIENYDDKVNGDTVRNQDTSLFLKYGNLILNNGGELGIHGYNHEPLCLKGIDDDRQYGDYKLWNSEASIKSSLLEVQDFSQHLFPKNYFSVYVPPSNILSETTRKVLTDTLPNIKVIASTYYKDKKEHAWEQEFSVDQDGIVNTPRIVSGCDVENYQLITELSELNFQFVQSHFMHPDDLLDEDRGAAEGWNVLSTKFRSYLSWLNSSATGIRQTTGSEMGNAVESYCNLSVNRVYQDNELTMSIGGFSKEAYFIMRLNQGKIEQADGCTCESITGDLYLVHATQSDVTITFQE